MKSASFLLVILALVACGPSGVDQSASAANEKIVRQLFDHFNKHDWKAMAELYTDPAEFKDPSFGLYDSPNCRSVAWPQRPHPAGA